jgi:hypothetical protein
MRLIGMAWFRGSSFSYFFIAVAVLGSLAGTAFGVEDKPNIFDPYGQIEGPGEPPIYEAASPGAGATILSSVPADYDWWNGCSPTAAGMLFGWWEENGYDSFPGNHRNLPGYYSNTTSNPNDYKDARGVIVSWENKAEGIKQGLTYGSYENHAPNCIGDFILTKNSGTNRSTIARGLEMFGAWDDPRTIAIESRRFDATNVYTASGWNYANYCAEINAGRPVHLGLDSSDGRHSVLGVGYNNTGGKQNVVLLTTWHWGLEEWEWSNDTQSGHSYTVYGATVMNAISSSHPLLSAYFSLAHTYVGDLSVEIGIGDPANPLWSTTAWSNGGSSDDNLILTDIDCTGALNLYRQGQQTWYLKVHDDAGGDDGTIEDFQIRYGFDQIVFDYSGAAIAINDNATSYVYVTTIPEPAALMLLAIGSLGLVFAWKKRK